MTSGGDNGITWNFNATDFFYLKKLITEKSNPFS